MIVRTMPRPRSKQFWATGARAILATIEERYGLPSLSTRDAAVNSLSNVFDAKQVDGG